MESVLCILKYVVYTDRYISLECYSPRAVHAVGHCQHLHLAKGICICFLFIFNCSFCMFIVSKYIVHTFQSCDACVIDAFFCELG